MEAGTQAGGADAGAEVELFAGIPVRSIGPAREWWSRLLGGEPAFLPHDGEAAWELGANRYLYAVELPERAGRGLATIVVADLDGWVAAAAARGRAPAHREAYDNGVRKVIYRDPDGNEFGVAGRPEGG